MLTGTTTARVGATDPTFQARIATEMVGRLLQQHVAAGGSRGLWTMTARPDPDTAGGILLELRDDDPELQVCDAVTTVLDVGSVVQRPQPVRCSRPAGHADEHGAIRAHVLHTWPQ